MIARRVRVERTGTIVRTNSSFVNGIASFPVALTAG
jgi:hypothetical protein